MVNLNKNTGSIRAINLIKESLRLGNVIIVNKKSNKK